MKRGGDLELKQVWKVLFLMLPLMFAGTVVAQNEAAVEEESATATLAVADESDTDADATADAEAEEEEASDDEAVDLDRVTVTGSRLQRETYTSIAPLQIITAEGSREIG